MDLDKMRVRLIGQCKQCSKIMYQTPQGICPRCIENNAIQDSIDLYDEEETKDN
jgi:uncharacterized OB-fold protein